MKRFVAVVLVAVMMLGMTGQAIELDRNVIQPSRFGQTITVEKDEGDTYTIIAPGAGTMTIAYRAWNTHGYLRYLAISEIDADSNEEKEVIPLTQIPNDKENNSFVTIKSTYEGQRFKLYFKTFEYRYYHHYMFSVCFDGYHTHTEFPELIQEANCAESGIAVHKCSVCGTEICREVIPALGHAPATTTTPATCIRTGQQLTACTNCGLVYANVELPVCEHIPGVWVDKTLATCTAPGHRVQRCSTCNVDINTATVPAHGHSPMEWVVTKRNGCLTPGERVQKCSVCAMTIATETLPALPHAWTAWVTDLEPSATMEGRLSRFCTNCGKEDIIVLPKTN